MKALKILLIVVGSLLALWALLGAFAKNTYHVERNLEIDAPRDIVHEQLRNFKNLKNWSPWHVYDPNMKTDISGTDGEPGAVYSWSGNDEVGTGTQTLKSVSPDRIDIDVKIQDWGTTWPAYFAIQEKGKKTEVTWGMDMQVPFPWNAFAMLTDVNAFVGKDFENGLLNLKKVCEQIAHPKYRGFEVGETELPARYYAAVRREVAFQDIPAFYGGNLPELMNWVTTQKLTPAGAPTGLYWTYDETAGKTDMAAAIPVMEQGKGKDSVQIVVLEAGRALVVDYYGPYEKTGEAHLALDDYMKEKKLQYRPPVIEEYITDPGSEPDTAKWLTKVIYFVAPLADSTATAKK